MGETVETIVEKAAPAAPISILECFNLEKRLSEGIKHIVRQVERKFDGQTSPGAVYNLYCLIAHELMARSQKIPLGMNYDAFCRLYKVNGYSDESVSLGTSPQ